MGSLLTKRKRRDTTKKRNKSINSPKKTPTDEMHKSYSRLEEDINAHPSETSDLHSPRSRELKGYNRRYRKLQDEDNMHAEAKKLKRPRQGCERLLERKMTKSKSLNDLSQGSGLHNLLQVSENSRSSENIHDQNIGRSDLQEGRSRSRSAQFARKGIIVQEMNHMDGSIYASNDPIFSISQDSLYTDMESAMESATDQDSLYTNMESAMESATDQRLIIPLYQYNKKSKRLRAFRDNINTMAEELNQGNGVHCLICAASGVRDPLMRTIFEAFEARFEKRFFSLSDIGGEDNADSYQPGIYLVTNSFREQMENGETEYIFIQYMESEDIFLHEHVRTALMKIYFQLGNFLFYGIHRRFDDMNLEDIVSFIPDGQPSYRSAKDGKRKTLCVLLTSWLDPSLYGYGREGGTCYIDGLMYRGPYVGEKMQILKVFDLPDCFLLPRPERITDLLIEEVVDYIKARGAALSVTEESLSEALGKCNDVMIRFNQQQPYY